jgi:AcrR family transcriptional regulator
MGEVRRRLSPDHRRAELLAWGAEMFGRRPYDEVRIDEVAECAGVSRALMYHYFPDKRAFFDAVVDAEAERLFEATRPPQGPGQTLFARIRAAVLACLDYHERHPNSVWAAYLGVGRADPLLLAIEEVVIDRQMPRIVALLTEVVPCRERGLDGSMVRAMRMSVAGWLAFTFEVCRQQITDPVIDAGLLGDVCAHALLDTIARLPGIPTELAGAVAPERR